MRTSIIKIIIISKTSLEACVEKLNMQSCLGTTIQDRITRKANKSFEMMSSIFAVIPDQNYINPEPPHPQKKKKFKCRWKSGYASIMKTTIFSLPVCYPKI